MNFIQFKFDNRGGLGPKVRLFAMTIGLSLLAAVAIADAVVAQPNALNPPSAQTTQTIALKPADAPGQGAIANPPQDFRLLGYGLFLLQIGLIPLKLAKGNQVQTIMPN
jgi:hypothetical protein